MDTFAEHLTIAKRYTLLYVVEILQSFLMVCKYLDVDVGIK